MKGVGVLSREDAISFGATGGTGRASGWACDTRKRHPYSMYGKVDFKEIVHTEGDSFARYMVRMEEIMESMNIIEQLIDNIPEGARRFLLCCGGRQPWRVRRLFGKSWR